MGRKDYYNSEREKVARAAQAMAEINRQQEEAPLPMKEAKKKWGDQLNDMLADKEVQRTMRYLYLNPAQLTVYNFCARHTTVEAGRATGKTDGLIAPYIIRCVQSMPGATGLFLGNSIKQLFSRTVPAVIHALERMGFKEGIHYFRGHAPKKANFKEPYVRPQRWDNVLHFYNGFVLVLVSTAVTGSANGMSVFMVVADEAKFIPERKFTEEILATLRGSTINTDNPGFNDKLNPLCKSTFLVSDAPMTPRQAWLYKRKKMDTEDVNEKIAEMLAEMTICPEILESDKFQRELNKLRCQSYAYFRFSSIENIDILGENYIKDMQKNMPSLVFDVTVRSIENEVGSDGYYTNLNIEDVHGYRNTDDSQLKIAERFNKRYVTQSFSQGRSFMVESNRMDYDEMSKNKTCIWDTDIIPGEPLRIAFDYNSSVNAMVIGQTPSRNDTSILKVINSMYVKNNRKIESLCGDFCRYYEPHKGSCNDVIFYYDSTAKQGGSYASEQADETRFYNIVKRVLKRNGWNVVEVCMGRPMVHNQKFEFLNGCLEGRMKPFIRFNIENNHFLTASMEMTLVKQTTKGFMKYKDAEKLKSMEYSEDGLPSQSGVTDITDAFDTLVIGVRYYGVGRLRGVTMPIIM